ncbi:MAG: hypothetical protein ABIF12_03840 [bacterium]
MKFFKIYIILFLSLFLNFENSRALDPQDLAGSMNLINPSVKDYFRENLKSQEHYEWLLSPLLGAKLWESKIIWNIYKFLPDEDPLVLLVKDLFNENQGAFLESTLPKNMAYHLNIEMIGYLVAALLTGKFREEIIEYFKTNKMFQDSKDATKQRQQEYKGELDELKKEKSSFSKNLKTVLSPRLDYYTSEVSSFLKSGDLYEANEVVYQFIITNYEELIRLLNVDLNKDFNLNLDSNLKWEKSKEYVLLIEPVIEPVIKERSGSLDRQQKKDLNKINGRIKAAKRVLNIINIDGFLKEYQRARFVIKRIKKLETLISNNNISSEMESNFIDNLISSGESSPFYPANMNVMVLLAFLYKKVNNKDDLLQYFSAVSNNLGMTLNDLIDSGKFKETIFDKNYEKVLSDFENYEDFLIAQIMFYFLSGLPKLATYKGHVEYGNTNFPDCMETALRNLFNINFFNEGTFNLPDVVSEELKDFYKLQNPLNVSNSNVHFVWANLVANKGYYFYLQVAIRGQEYKSIYKSCLLLPKGHNLNLDDFELGKEEVDFNDEKVLFKTIRFNERDFLLIDKNDEKYADFVCFEVYPSLSNVILCFNEFLNLNLIDFSSYFKDDFESVFLLNDIFENYTSFDTVTLVDKDGNVLEDNGDVFGNYIFKIVKKDVSFELHINIGSHGEIPHGDIVEPQLDISKKYLTRFFDDIRSSDSSLYFALLTGSLDLDFFIQNDFPVIGLLLLNLSRELNRAEFLKSIVTISDLTDDHIIFIEKVLNSFDFFSDVFRKILKYCESLDLDKRIKDILDKKVKQFITKSLKSNDPHTISQSVEFVDYFYKNSRLRENVLKVFSNYLITGQGNVDIQANFKNLVDKFYEKGDLGIKKEVLSYINTIVNGFINQSLGFVDLDFMAGLYEKIFSSDSDLELRDEFESVFDLAIKCLESEYLSTLGQRMLGVLNNCDKNFLLELIRSRGDYSINQASNLLAFDFKYMVDFIIENISDVKDRDPKKILESVLSSWSGSYKRFKLDDYQITILYKTLIDLGGNYREAVSHLGHIFNKQDLYFYKLLNSILVRAEKEKFVLDDLMSTLFRLVNKAEHEDLFFEILDLIFSNEALFFPGLKVLKSSLYYLNKDIIIKILKLIFDNFEFIKEEEFNGVILELLEINRASLANSTKLSIEVDDIWFSFERLLEYDFIISKLKDFILKDFNNRIYGEKLLVILERLFALDMIGFDIVVKLLRNALNTRSYWNQQEIDRYAGLALLSIKYNKNLRDCLDFFLCVLDERYYSPMVIEGLELLLKKGFGLKEVICFNRTIDNRMIESDLNQILDKYKNTEKYESSLLGVILEEAFEKSKKEKDLEVKRRHHVEEKWRREHPISSGLRNVFDAIDSFILRSTREKIQKMYDY